MGVGLRIFLVLGDNSLLRLPNAQYDRLKNGDPSGRLPQFAGRRVRCAFVYLDLRNRELVCIRRIDYHILHFNAAGGFDVKKAMDEQRLVMAKLSLKSLESNPIGSVGNVVQAEKQFIRKKLKHEFTWTPNQSIKSKIISAVYRERKTKTARKEDLRLAPACRDCLFFKYQDEKANGLCRRFPPQIYQVSTLPTELSPGFESPSHIGSGWPEVSVDDFCGEHRLNDDSMYAMTCASCKVFSPIAIDDLGGPLSPPGKCRMRPPTIFHGLSNWPVVNSSDQCGEWQPRSPERRYPER